MTDLDTPAFGALPKTRKSEEPLRWPRPFLGHHNDRGKSPKENPQMKFVSTLIAALLCVAPLALAEEPPGEWSSLTAKTGSGDSYAPCPAGSTHRKVDHLSGSSYTYTAPSGYVVVQTQVKARVHQTPVTYDPGERTVTVYTTSKHDISHLHVCKTKVPDEPPPECEPGDPCWCDENPEDPDCQSEPEEVCDLSTFGFTQSEWAFGFTTDVNAPEGSGCSNSENFTGEPGDQVRFDVCLNGSVFGDATLVKPELPFVDSEIVTVSQSSDVVTGEVEVVVADLQFDGCEKTYAYRWAGSVAANTEEACQYGEPCWCVEHPDDPRCAPPEPECSAYASIEFNVVDGWVAPEECYAGLSPADFTGYFTGDVTVCWRGRGGPDSANVFAKANGMNYPALPLRSYAWIGGTSDLRGRIVANGRDEANGCGAGDLLWFEILRQRPEQCVLWDELPAVVDR